METADIERSDRTISGVFQTTITESQLLRLQFNRCVLFEHNANACEDSQTDGEGCDQHLGLWDESLASHRRDPQVKELPFDPS